jgi:hypothetical protein
VTQSQSQYLSGVKMGRESRSKQIFALVLSLTWGLLNRTLLIMASQQVRIGRENDYVHTIPT